MTLTINLSNYAPIRMTDFIKKKEIENNWLLIDAENAIVGRLAAYISTVLRGKNKNQYTPHMDNGDFVVVTNIEKIKFTGKKFNNKKYYRHTGYPGGIKSTTPITLMKIRIAIIINREFMIIYYLVKHYQLSLVRLVKILKQDPRMKLS